MNVTQLIRLLEDVRNNMKNGDTLPVRLEFFRRGRASILEPLEGIDASPAHGVILHTNFV